MTDGLGSVLPSVFVLGAALALAAFLTSTRQWSQAGKASTRGAARVALAAVLVQSAHFTEELSSAFHEKFPALFGLPPISARLFVLFNLSWLAVWLSAAWGLSARLRVALFPLWFLAIACVVNGVAHPSLALVSRGYFPGLITSPVVGVLGLLLLRQLLHVTERGNAPAGVA